MWSSVVLAAGRGSPLWVGAVVGIAGTAGLAFALGLGRRRRP